MKRIIWTRSATEDLVGIRDYLTNFGPEVAQDTLDRIILAAHWLLRFPSAGSPMGYRRWRKWRPRKTRYVLIYEPTDDGISVVRVHHAHQDWRVVPE